MNKWVIFGIVFFIICVIVGIILGIIYGLKNNNNNSILTNKATIDTQDITIGLENNESINKRIDTTIAKSITEPIYTTSIKEITEPIYTNIEKQPIQQTTIPRSPTTTIRIPTTIAISPTTTSRTPTTIERSLTTTSRIPTTIAISPITTSRTPTTIARLPTTTSRTPTTTSRTPTTIAISPTTIARIIKISEYKFDGLRAFNYFIKESTANYSFLVFANAMLPNTPINRKNIGNIKYTGKLKKITATGVVYDQQIQNINSFFYIGITKNDNWIIKRTGYISSARKDNFTLEIIPSTTIILDSTYQVTIELHAPSTYNSINVDNLIVNIEMELDNDQVEPIISTIPSLKSNTIMKRFTRTSLTFTNTHDTPIKYVSAFDLIKFDNINQIGKLLYMNISITAYDGRILNQYLYGLCDYQIGIIRNNTVIFSDTRNTWRNKINRIYDIIPSAKIILNETDRVFIQLIAHWMNTNINVKDLIIKVYIDPDITS